MVSKHRSKNTIRDDKFGFEYVVCNIFTHNCPASKIANFGDVVVELLDGWVLWKFHIDFDSVFLVHRIDDHAALAACRNWDEEA